MFKAQWYGRNEGYQGTTYEKAEEFCANVAGMDLCPREAYCPNGPIAAAVSKPLFLQHEAFEGEQWAPVKDEYQDDSYILVGKISGNPVTTCHTYRHFRSGEMPQWALDGSSPELKMHILCCKDPQYVSNSISNPVVDLTIGGPAVTDQVPADEFVDLESVALNDDPDGWFDDSDGWFGGSHDDAVDYCASRGGKEICPYSAYCPHGPGQPVSQGHSTDISAEGVQWAPVYAHENYWVMVGQKHENSATTCFSYEDLEGGLPDWGLTSKEHEIKKHIMCCRLRLLSLIHI